MKENEKLVRNLDEMIENESKLKEKNEELRRLLEANKKQITLLEEQKHQITFTSKKKVMNKFHKSGKKEIVATAEKNTSILIMHTSAIYLLESSVNCWKKLKNSLPIKMCIFGAALVNGEIYIFGGENAKKYYQHCYKLKIDGTWMELAPLNEKRSLISNSSVVYFGEIWVIGGYSGYQHLKSVEKYNISQNKWIQMPDLNESRSDAAAAVYKNKIIVTGGFGAESSAELFDPKLQKWIIFFQLPIDIYNHCMTISGSILTIYGGLSGSATAGVWEMNLEDPRKKWTEKQNLKYLRHSFGIAKLSNGIMAIGGGGNDGTTEIFVGNNWKEGPRLPQEMSDFAYTAIHRSVERDLLTKFS